MKRKLYLIITSLALVACDKEEDGPASLVGSWTRTEMYTIDNAGNRSHNLHDYSAECEKDNVYRFMDNNDFFLNEGSKVCSPSSENTDKYELLDNGAKVKFQKGGIWTISSLSNSSLEITQPTAFATGFREVVTVFKKK